jgi:hypothetical protein
MAEVKVTYVEAGSVRSLHGTILDESDWCVKLGRSDVTVRLNKRFIIKIEEGGRYVQEAGL